MLFLFHYAFFLDFAKNYVSMICQALLAPRVGDHFLPLDVAWRPQRSTRYPKVARATPGWYDTHYIFSLGSTKETAGQNLLQNP